MREEVGELSPIYGAKVFDDYLGDFCAREEGGLGVNVVDKGVCLSKGGVLINRGKSFSHEPCLFDRYLCVSVSFPG